MTLDHEARALGIGGSDAPKVHQVSPFGGRTEVYLEKTGQLPASVKPTGTQLGRGQLAEPALRQWFADEIGKPVSGGRMFTGPESWMRANIDGIWMISARPFGWEGKTTVMRAGWAETGAEATGIEAMDIMPPHIACQPLHYLAVTQWPRWDVAVALAPYWIDDVVDAMRAACATDQAIGLTIVALSEKRRYTIWRDEEWEREVFLPPLRAFWFEHVVPRIPPPLDGSKAAAAHLLARHPRELGGIIDASPEQEVLLRQLQHARAEAKRLKLERKALEVATTAVIGDHEGIQARSMDKPVTWRHQAGARRIDSKRLRAELPDVAREYTTRGADKRVLLAAALDDWTR